MNMPGAIPETPLPDAARGAVRAGFRYSPAILPGLLRVLDIAVICAVAMGMFYALGMNEYYFSENYVFAAVFIAFCFYFLTYRTNIYSAHAIMRPVSHSDDIIVLIFTSVMLFLSVIFALKVSQEYSRAWFLGFTGGSVLGIIAVRVAICRALRRLSRRKIIGRSLVVLGAGEQSRRFLRRLDDAMPFFTTMLGVFRYQAAGPDAVFEGHPVLGGIDELFAMVRERRVDDVVVALPWNADQALTQTVERLKELPVNVYLSTDLVGFELAFRPVMGSLADLPMFEVVQRPISGWSSAFKTIEDYVLATLGLLIVSPLLLIVAAAIRLDSPGPVFFMQKRLGFNNEEFFIYKFRSMHHSPAEESRVRQATKGDPRVTRVGRFIRATSIDELPQLLNVLNGTMSLVGPRPHALSHNEEYGRRIRGYFARHRVKPGITGWAQVNGLRGETETIDKMEARIRYDIYYADNWSLLFDVKILILTVVAVLFHKTAY